MRNRDAVELAETSSAKLIDHHIVFGCEVSRHFQECYIMDEASSFKIHPDGVLSTRAVVQPYGKIFSQRRLYPEHRAELAREISVQLEKYHSFFRMYRVARHIATQLLDQIVFSTMQFLLQELSQKLPQHSLPSDSAIKKNINKITNHSALQKISEEAELLIVAATAISTETSLDALQKQCSSCLSFFHSQPNFSSVSSDEPVDAVRMSFSEVVTQKGNDVIQLANQKLREVLINTFDESVADDLINQFFSNNPPKTLRFLCDCLSNRNDILKKFSRLIYAHIDRSLTINKNRVAELIEPLKRDSDLAFSTNEKLMVAELQEHLTESEMSLLESRQVAIIAANSLQDIASHNQCRGTFKEDTIFLKTTSIRASIIHEVYHGIGFDISVFKFLQFLKFNYQCQETRFSFFQGINIRMTDIQQVCVTQEGNGITVGMISRARYLALLPNYPAFDRTKEVLAHLRQFIADFGVEKTEILLPKLFKFWKTEIYDKSLVSSEPILHARYSNN